MGDEDGNGTGFGRWKLRAPDYYGSIIRDGLSTNDQGDSGFNAALALAGDGPGNFYGNGIYWSWEMGAGDCD